MIALAVPVLADDPLDSNLKMVEKATSAIWLLWHCRASPTIEP